MFKYLFCIGLLIISIDSAYAMDQIEQTYYEQLENINTDIKMHRLQMDYHLKLLDIDIKFGIINSPMSQQFLEDERKMRGLKQRRLELRLQVLEKYGKLPDWWKEPN